MAPDASPGAGNHSEIVCEGLYKWFGENLVLAGFDLTVRDNEFVCIVGPSGCGKTTLLRMIAGLADIDHGTIAIGGEVVSAPSPRVAVVFQHFGLFPWKTVHQNIALALKASSTPVREIDGRVREVTALVGLANAGDRYPHQLSGGMKQRAGLARALVMHPDVLLLDEPFASVDAQTREMLQEQLLDLWSTHHQTSVFITHSIDEALLLADRIVVLGKNPGRVIDDIVVPIPRPRTATSVRRHDAYASLRELIRNELTESDGESDVSSAAAGTVPEERRP